MFNQFCDKAVDKMRVVVPQRRIQATLGTVRNGLFAYNEVPTFAVAIDCWFRARPTV